MNPNEARAAFFVKARRQRYAWAKRVDPKGVAKFERRLEERRKRS